MLYQILTLLFYIGITGITYVLARKDLETHRVADTANLAIAFTSIIPIALQCFVPGATPWKVILSHLAGGLFAFIIMLFACAVSKGGFGGGDIKLMGALGLWFSVWQSLLLTVIAALTYLGFIVFIRKQHAKKMTEPPKVVPYVPFVFISTIIATVIYAVPVVNQIAKLI